MTVNRLFKTLIIVAAITNLISCSTEKSEYIIDEQFDTNKLGWVEERTDFHYLNIRKGEYLIHSLDTSVARSSTGTMAGRYLYDLPMQYEITTSVKLVKKNSNKVSFGLFLYSSTLEYGFTIYSDGEIIVSEYDYNRESSINLLSKKIKLTPSDSTDIMISINDMGFELIVNDISIGTATFRTETSSWHDLRLFTSSGSAILVDYLRIKEK